MNASLKPEPKKRGRKSESPAEKLARLERDIATARQAVAQAETRRLATIGSAILAEAQDNPKFLAEVQKLLRARVTTKAGQADIASLLNAANLSVENEPASPAS